MWDVRTLEGPMSHGSFGRSGRKPSSSEGVSPSTVLAWPPMEAAARPALEPGRAGLVLLGSSGAVLGLALLWGGGSGTIPLRVAVPTVLVAAVAGGLALRGVLAVPALDRSARLFVSGVLGLTLWAGLSIVWSLAGDLSWEQLNRGLVLLAFLVLGLLVGALPAGVRPLAFVVSGLVGVTIGWALLGVAVPSLSPDGDRVARLREPIGYWNALALLADVGLALGLWLVLERRRAVRLAGGLLVFGALVVLLLTQSRAGVVAAAVVIAFVLHRSTRRLEAALLGLVAGAPGAAVAAWAFTRPALVEDAAGRAARVDDARLFAVALGLGAALAAALVLFVPVARLVEQHERVLARLLASAALLIALIGVVALIASVGNPARWGADQIGGGECTNDPGRLTELCDNNRIAWWGDALEIARDHPVLGTGAGTYAIARLRIRDDATPVAEPHSVPLQLLADLGVVGLVLGVLTAVGGLFGIRAALRRLDGTSGPEAVALATLPLAWGVHALVDYDLDFVAVTGPALLVTGALLAAGRPRRGLSGGLPGLLVLAAVAVAVVGLVALPPLAQRSVDRVYAAPDLASAAAAASRARSLDPLSLDPVIAQAYVAELAGDPGRAQELLEEATRMQPRNPEPWLELARFHYAAEPPDYCAAYEAFNAAYTLDPRSSRWVPGGPLDRSRDEVNAGACEE